MSGYSGGGRTRPPQCGRQWDCLPKISGICKHLKQIVLCLRFLLHGKLTTLPNPLARFKWAARRGGESNKRGRGKMKERKEKGGIGKGGVALAARKKSQGHPCLNLLLNRFKNGQLVIKMCSSFRISLHLYLILLLQKNFTQTGCLQI